MDVDPGCPIHSRLPYETLPDAEGRSEFAPMNRDVAPSIFWAIDHLLRFGARDSQLHEADR